jgi:hypothetical protein
MNSNQQHNTIYRPYCYLIGWSKLNKFYYGVRHSRKSKCLYESGCHPDDFWITYFTSSATVEEYRKLYGEPDIIQIRKTFDTAELATRWENTVLRRMLTGRSKEKFLNGQYNGLVVFTEEVRHKMSEAKKGRRLSEETKRRLSEINKGRVISEEWKRKISEAHKGKVPRLHTEETKRKMRESRKHQVRKPQTEETKRKISESQKLRIANRKHSNIITI